jgi:hypothetical protein
VETDDLIRISRSREELQHLNNVPAIQPSDQTKAAAKRFEVFYEDSSEEGEEEMEEQADMASDEDEEVKLPDFSSSN